MNCLVKAVLSEPEIARTVAAVEAGGCPAVISGLSPVHRAHLAAAIRAATGRCVVYLASDEMELRRVALDLEAFTGESVCTVTSRDFIFRDMEGASREYEQLRLRALMRISGGGEAFITTTAWALMQRAVPREVLRASTATLVTGETHDLDALCEKLTGAGYTRSEQVDGRGQFARRGGILDFYSPAHELPVRAEFFGDEIDSLTFFDPSSQRRGDFCDYAVIMPAAETLPGLSPRGVAGLIEALETLSANAKGSRGAALRERVAADISRLRDGRSFPAADKYMELLYPFATALDYLPEDAVVLISEPLRVREASERAEKQMFEECAPLLESGALDSSLLRFCESSEGLFAALERFPTVMSDVFTTSQYPLTPRTLASVLAKQLPSYGGSLDTAAGDLSHYAEGGYGTVITVSTRERADALAEFLSDRKIKSAVDYELTAMPPAGSTLIAVGTLSAGMEYPGIKLAVLTEGQFTQSREARPRKSKARTNRERVQSFTDLTVGDLVVHEHHGIGRYLGIFQITIDGVKKDYIKIGYQGGDSLYIPATQLDMVSKYIGGGGEDSPVRLSKMGGVEWTKSKSRARGAARDMAKELIALYAARQRSRGHAFAPDSVWQTEFEEKFGYAETDDQIKCVSEIKSDMEKDAPMDRLLCGDVGYGKTEVALRAAMKCILDGHQAAVLVPTTVLARQHYVTASKRFAGYPVNIEVLSRFRTPAEMKKAVKRIKSGSADLVIGTHRLLQKDIEF
ncbi:MAG: DEAD/DEAH box helicase, partial [Oscillospiraceae bacterium]|nr:DEAD/DEAH box helicase [Oscillospiraceae bacterium]